MASWRSSRVSVTSPSADVRRGPRSRQAPTTVHMVRRHRATTVAMILATALQLLGQAVPVAATVTPTSQTTPAGTTTHFDVSVAVPAVPPKADILIAIDTTGSMSSSIGQAKTDAAAIVNGVQGAVPDSQFAVVEFKDLFDTHRVRRGATMTADSAPRAGRHRFDSGGGRGGNDNRRPTTSSSPTATPPTSAAVSGGAQARRRSWWSSATPNRTEPGAWCPISPAAPISRPIRTGWTRAPCLPA